MNAGEVILEAVGVVTSLIGRAISGDHGAQEQLRHVLPPELHTELVAKAQDALDQAKFGPRPT